MDTSPSSSSRIPDEIMSQLLDSCQTCFGTVRSASHWVPEQQAQPTQKKLIRLTFNPQEPRQQHALWSVHKPLEPMKLVLLDPTTFHCIIHHTPVWFANLQAIHQDGPHSSDGSFTHSLTQEGIRFWSFVHLGSFFLSLWYLSSQFKPSQHISPPPPAPYLMNLSLGMPHHLLHPGILTAPVTSLGCLGLARSSLTPCPLEHLRLAHIWFRQTLPNLKTKEKHHSQ